MLKRILMVMKGSEVAIALQIIVFVGTLGTTVVLTKQSPQLQAEEDLKPEVKGAEDNKQEPTQDLSTTTQPNQINNSAQTPNPVSKNNPSPTTGQTSPQTQNNPNTTTQPPTSNDSYPLLDNFEKGVMNDINNRYYQRRVLLRSDISSLLCYYSSLDYTRVQKNTNIEEFLKYFYGADWRTVQLLMSDIESYECY